jgi:hypothetical protein
VIDKESLLAREDNFKDIHFDISKVINDTSLFMEENLIRITFNSDNPDPIEVSVEKYTNFYRVSYWDGYAVNEFYDYQLLNKALKKFSKFSYKALDNINKFGLK